MRAAFFLPQPAVFPDGQGGWHGLVAFGGDDGINALWHRQAHQPRAGAQRSPGAQHRRAGVPGGTAHHQHPAEVSFVAVRRTAGQPAPDQSPVDDMGVKGLASKNVLRDADVVDNHLSGPQRPLAHEQAGLGHGEGDGDVRPHRIP